MTETSNNNAPSSRKTRRSRSIIPYLLLLCALIIALFFYFRFQKTSLEKEPLSHELTDETQTVSTTSLGKVQDQQPQYSVVPGTDVVDKNSATSEETVAIANTPTESLGQVSSTDPVNEQAGQLAVVPVTDDYDKAVERINAFYANIDRQQYLKNFNFSPNSKIHFSRLIQKILDTPPIVVGETNDLFSILQNTAHFFRVVGSENVLAMKAILINEKKMSEQILSDFYSLTKQPQYLLNNFDIQLKEDSLYEYAGFFLTTMGGRLYLFRRDSALRMIVSYYAILIVDKANRLGMNRHGIDIKPMIANLIDEMENSGSQLQLKEHYLDNLYDIQESIQ